MNWKKKASLFFFFWKTCLNFFCVPKVSEAECQKFCGKKKKSLKYSQLLIPQCWIIVLNYRQLLWIETWAWLVFSAKYSYMNRKYIMFSTSVEFCYDFSEIIKCFLPTVLLGIIKNCYYFWWQQSCEHTQNTCSHEVTVVAKRMDFSLDYVFVCHFY